MQLNRREFLDLCSQLGEQARGILMTMLRPVSGLAAMIASATVVEDREGLMGEGGEPPKADDELAARVAALAALGSALDTLSTAASNMANPWQPTGEGTANDLAWGFDDVATSLAGDPSIPASPPVRGAGMAAGPVSFLTHGWGEPAATHGKVPPRGGLGLKPRVSDDASVDGGGSGGEGPR